MRTNLILIFGLLKICEVQPADKIRMIPIKVECEWNETFFTNGTCSMTPVPTGGALVTLGGSFVKETNKLWLQHANYEKVGRNKYRLGIINLNFDICDFNNAIKRTILNRFADVVTKDIRDYIHPCPYSGSLYLENLPFASGALYLKLMRPASYRLDYRLYGEHNTTYFYFKFYGVIGTKL